MAAFVGAVASGAPSPVPFAVRRQHHARHVRHRAVARVGQSDSRRVTDTSASQALSAGAARTGDGAARVPARVAQVYARPASGPLSFWHEAPELNEARRSDARAVLHAVSGQGGLRRAVRRRAACRCSTIGATSAGSTTRLRSRSTVWRDSIAGASAASAGDRHRMARRRRAGSSRTCSRTRTASRCGSTTSTGRTGSCCKRRGIRAGAGKRPVAAGPGGAEHRRRRVRRCGAPGVPVARAAVSSRRRAGHRYDGATSGSRSTWSIRRATS